MSTRQDEDIRIYELPEAQELTAGMKVAVDSETDGTKSFDLSNLAGKVDEPVTAPEAGQVLTFDGTGNTWANPPEGVYVLNYTDVTNLDDIDIEKATTIPTFILIDSDQTLTIGNSTSSDTISIKAGTIMRLEEVGGDDNGKPMFLTFVNDYGKSSTGGTYMTYGNYFIRLVVSKSMYGGVSKQFGVSADIWDSNLFRSQQIPVVKKYNNARGPAESSGNLNGDANSLIVSFEDAGSNKRRQLLPPAELASHDFSTDTTPEQIQFMGWGATSNRAGYKSCLVATHSSRSSEYPAQTPTVSFNRYVMGSSETSDNVATSVNVEMISSVSGQGSAMFGGNLVPTLGTTGALQYWSDNSGPHYGFKPVKEVPTSTTQDEGKVLTVDSNGAAAWAQAASGSTTMAVDIPSTLTTDQEIVEFINTTVTAFNADSTKKSLIVYPPDSNVPYVYLRSDIVDPFYAHHFAADLSTVKYKENVTIHTWDYGNAPYSSPGQRLVKMYYKTTPQNNPQYKIRDFYSEPTEYKRYEIDSNYTMAEKYDAIVNALNDFYSLPDLWRYKGPYFIIGGYGEGPLLNRIYQEGDSDIITIGNPNFCSSTDYQKNCESYPVFGPFMTFHAEFWTGTPVYRITMQVATCGLGFMPTPEIDNQGNVYVSNNQITVLAPTISALTAIVRLGAYSNEAANFCLEITPTVQCTLTIKTIKYNGSQDVETTLKHSVAAGNVLEANKTYQVTVVGNCWTLAEFEA